MGLQNRSVGHCAKFIWKNSMEKSCTTTQTKCRSPQENLTPISGGGEIIKPIDILTGRGVSEYDGKKDRRQSDCHNSCKGISQAIHHKLGC